MKRLFTFFILYLFIWNTAVIHADEDTHTRPPTPPVSSESPNPIESFEALQGRIQDALQAGHDFDEFRLINAHVIQNGVVVPYANSRAAVEELSPQLNFEVTPVGDVNVTHPHLNNVVLRYSGVHATQVIERDDFVLIFVNKTDAAQKLIHNEPHQSKRVLGFYWFKKDTATQFPLSPFAWHFYRFPEDVTVVESDFTNDTRGKTSCAYFPQHQQVIIRKIVRQSGGESGPTDQITLAHFTLNERQMAIRHFSDQIALLGIALVHQNDIVHLTQLRTLLNTIQDTSVRVADRLRARPDVDQVHNNYVATLELLHTQLSPHAVFGVRATQEVMADGFRDPGRYAQTFQAVQTLSQTLNNALQADALNVFADIEGQERIENILLQTSSTTVAQVAQAGLQKWKAEKYPMGGLLGMMAILSAGAWIAYQQIASKFIAHWDGYLDHSLGLPGFWMEFGRLCTTNLVVLGIVMGAGVTLGIVTQWSSIRKVFPSLHFVSPHEGKGLVKTFEVNGSRLFQYINYLLNNIWKTVFPEDLQQRLKFGVMRALPEDNAFVQDLQRSLHDEPVRATVIREKRRTMETQFGDDKIKVLSFYHLLKEAGVVIKEENRPQILLMLDAFMGSDVQLKPATEPQLKIYQYLCVRTLELDGHGFQEGQEIPPDVVAKYKNVFERAKSYAAKVSPAIQTLMGGIFSPSLGTLATSGTFMLVSAAVLADWIPTMVSQMANKGWGDPRPYVEPIFMSTPDGGGHLSAIVSSYGIFQWILGYLMDFSLFGIYNAGIEDTHSTAKQGVMARFASLFQSKFFDSNGKLNLSKIFVGAYRTYLAVLPMRVIAFSISLYIKGQLHNPLSIDYALHYLLITAPILSAMYFMFFSTVINAFTGNTQRFSKTKKLAIFAATALTYGFVSSAVGEWTRTLEIFQHKDVAGALITDKFGRSQLGLSILHTPFWSDITVWNSLTVLGVGVVIWKIVQSVNRQQQQLDGIYKTSITTACK